MPLTLSVAIRVFSGDILIYRSCQEIEIRAIAIRNVPDLPIYITVRADWRGRVAVSFEDWEEPILHPEEIAEGEVA